MNRHICVDNSKDERLLDMIKVLCESGVDIEEVRTWFLGSKEVSND